MNLENEIPKYKKKKESNLSKSKSKSKHKHNYKECLLISLEDDKPYYANYCEICGKINNLKFFETEKIENGHYRNLSKEEVYEKYKDLERFSVENIWQKYISIISQID